MSKLTLKEFLVADAILGDSVTNENGLNGQTKWAGTFTYPETAPIDIEKEFDKFFEFDTDDKSVVTSVSCKLFAKYIAEMVRGKNNTLK